MGEEQGFGLKLTDENVPYGSMTWLMPDFTASSGGHINIARMIRLLKERGFPFQHVVIMEPHRWRSDEEAQAAFNAAFGDCGISLSLGVRSIEPCQFLVATGWQTAYWVAKYRDAIHHIYFVQDFEPAFFSSGSWSAIAEGTYKLGLTAVTAGSWLAEKLNREYGMRTFPFSFSYEHDIYKPYPKRSSDTKHIFFYARPETPRRCFELGIMSLSRVCRSRPNVAAILSGGELRDYHIPFHHLNTGSLAIAELPDLYSQCDVALVISASNLSLLPMEVAACGCPLVINRGPHSEWLFSEEEAFYCDLNPDSIVSSLNEVLDRPEEASLRANAAMQRAQQSSWGHEADKVASFLRTL
ncbi:glycosyltransferase family protein [Nitratireductor thuwali]|uniref:rhamnosyltransferase WsaF family glycosyltransferase n=1 Tax=Nitratireductor thuwali TaxID=2267699 RepID=UPI0030CA7A4F